MNNKNLINFIINDIDGNLNIIEDNIFFMKEINDDLPNLYKFINHEIIKFTNYLQINCLALKQILSEDEKD